MEFKDYSFQFYEVDVGDVVTISGGNVGIGTTDPQQALEVTGRIRMGTWTADGDTAVYKEDATGDIGVQTSDIRLKKNLVSLENPLEIIAGIDGFLFNPLDEEDGAKKRLGVSAQDVMAVLPEAVFEVYPNDPNFPNDPYYGVHYEKLGVLALEGIKTQQTQLIDLSLQLDENGTLVTGLQTDLTNYGVSQDIQSESLGALEARLDTLKTNSELFQQETSQTLAQLQEEIDSLKESQEGDPITTPDFLAEGEEDQVLKLDQDLALYQDLNVLGKTTLSELGLTGKLTAGLLVIDGLKPGQSCPPDSPSQDCPETGDDGASLATLTGPLYLQNKLTSGNLDVFAGKIVMTPEGNISTEGIITAKAIEAEEFKVKGSDSSGSSTLLANSTFLEIESKVVTPETKILITPTTLTDQVLAVTEKKDGVFKVEIKNIEALDIHFDWLVIN
jgi:hypothetical protein